MTKWNESTNPPEKKPLSDLQKRGLEAAEKRKSDRLERSMKRLKKEPDYPAKVISYNVNLGVYNVQKGSDVYQARSITNGAIAPGDNVALKPGTGGTALIDQMWLPRRKKVVESATAIGKNIKYVYTTGGSDPSRTALCVAGAKQGWTVQVDEWANSEFSLRSATIDNLGGTDFIVSYVLRKPVNVTFPNGTFQSFENTFKVSRNGNNIFSYILEHRYAETVGGNGLSVGLGFASPGYGSWITNRATDLATSNFESVSTIIDGGFARRSGDIVFRLSDNSFNNQVDSILDVLQYDASTVPFYPPNATTVAPSYGYLNPELKVDTYLNLQTRGYIGPAGGFTTSGFSYISQQSQFDTFCLRWDRAGRSLSYYTRTDASFDPAPEFYSPSGNISPNKFASGVFVAGYSVVRSRGSQPIEIPFRNLGLNQVFSISSDYSTQINQVAGSDTATVTGGVVPRPGSVVISGSLSYGTIILEVSGNTLKLSEPAADTTEPPDNLTAISTGFPSNMQGLFPIDLHTSDISYFSLTRLNRRSGQTFTLLSEPIEFPIALFGYDLRPTGYKMMKVYSPIIINPANPGVVLQNNFRIWHASYG